MKIAITLIVFIVSISYSPIALAQELNPVTFRLDTLKHNISDLPVLSASDSCISDIGRDTTFANHKYPLISRNNHLKALAGSALSLSAFFVVIICGRLLYDKITQ